METIQTSFGAAAAAPMCVSIYLFYIYSSRYRDEFICCSVCAFVFSSSFIYLFFFLALSFDFSILFAVI